MERLLEIAAAVSDQAEVYFVETDETNIEIRNSELNEITSDIQSGFSLRIIKDGAMGISYTKNLNDRDELVRNAVESLEGGKRVAFDFPGPSGIAGFDQFDPAISDTRPGDLYDRNAELVKFLNGRITGQVDVRAAAETKTVIIKNSNGLDVSQKRSTYEVGSEMLFPNTEAGVSILHGSIGPTGIPEKNIERAISLYTAGLPEVDVSTGKMVVVFLPETVFSLIWRIEDASSGRVFHQKIGPLLDREGDKIFSDKVTVINDPHDTDIINARWFDDEGMPTQKLELIKNGVFNGPYLDLDFAEKLGRTPTGNGFRAAVWGGDEITLTPSPGLAHLTILPGSTGFDEIVRNIDKGILVLGVLGPHSGNILNGDFSMGLNPGLYVEHGKILGRTRDAMISGNIYDVMQNVIMIENEKGFSGSCYYPSIAIADVAVTGRG